MGRRARLHLRRRGSAVPPVHASDDDTEPRAPKGFKTEFDKKGWPSLAIGGWQRPFDEPLPARPPTRHARSVRIAAALVSLNGHMKIRR